MTIQIAESVPPKKEPLAPAVPAGLLSAIQLAAETLIPAETVQWEIHVAAKRDDRGCRDINLHLHTCIEQQESKESCTEQKLDGAGDGGYL